MDKNDRYWIFVRYETLNGEETVRRFEIDKECYLSAMQDLRDPRIDFIDFGRIQYKKSKIISIRNGYSNNRF